MDLEIPLDRKAERNVYRSSLISLRRAERAYDLFSDRVRLQVRRALRRIERAKFTLLIQEEQIKSNEKRREQAQIQFDKGQISRSTPRFQVSLSSRKSKLLRWSGLVM